VAVDTDASLPLGTTINGETAYHGGNIGSLPVTDFGVGTLDDGDVLQNVGGTLTDTALSYGNIDNTPTSTNSFESTPTSFVTAASTGSGTGFDQKGIYARVSEISLSTSNDTTASIQYADGTSDSIGESDGLQKSVDKYAVEATVNNTDNSSNGGSVEIKIRDVSNHSHTI
jgi:hypothetical protein